jgi:hypothetical protein
MKKTKSTSRSAKKKPARKATASARAKVKKAPKRTGSASAKKSSAAAKYQQSGAPWWKAFL